MRNKGKPVSPETREKLRLANVGKKSSVLGRHHSIKSKFLMSIVHKNISPETRKKNEFSTSWEQEQTREN